MEADVSPSRLLRFLNAIKSDFNVPEVLRVEAVELLDRYNGPPPCVVCKSPVMDCYMVEDEVWYGEAGFDKGQAHLMCLQGQIGRRLTFTDFAQVSVNDALRFGYMMAATG